jgi:hypothetical protein
MLLRKFSLLLAIGLTGCSPKFLILQSPIVSMKKANSEVQKDLAEGGVVNEKWCASDTPIVPNDDGSLEYGLIDQVILKAHQKSNYDFFKDAKFYQQGTCVSMNAKGAGPRGAGAEPAARKKKAKKA